jgi:hypothetical protein
MAAEVVAASCWAGELNAEQVTFLEKLAPCSKKRHVERERPGQLLSASTSVFATLKGIGRIYLHKRTAAFGHPPACAGG